VYEGGGPVADGFEALPGDSSKGGVCGVSPAPCFLGGLGEKGVELVEESGGDVEHESDDVEAFWVLGSSLIFETFAFWSSNTGFEHGEWSTFG